MWCEYELTTAEKTWRWRIDLDAKPSCSLPVLDDRDEAPRVTRRLCGEDPLECRLAVKERPRWTDLGCSRCKDCPLQAADDAPCPAAIAVQDVVDALSDVASIDAVDVVVRLPEREVRKTTTGANAARSVFGLLLATSGCPVLEVMRPLARHHLPFATEEEFLLRLVGLHLLQSWFAAGGSVSEAAVSAVSLRSLPAYLAQLQALNTAFAARLRAACAKDAGPNAMCQLFSLSLGAGCDVDDGLSSLRAFVVGPEAGVATPPLR